MLKSGSELTSDSSQEVNFSRTFSCEKRDWWISCLNGFGFLWWPFYFSHMILKKLWSICHTWASQVALGVKNSPANAGNARVTRLIPELGRSPGGRHGNPLHYSCLEKSMHRGAWQTAVHGVAKSQTQLNNWVHTYTHVTYNIIPEFQVYNLFFLANWLHCITITIYEF